MTGATASPEVAVRRADPIPARAGIGLRHHHYRAIIDSRPPVGWIEVHSENYFGGGRPLAFLEAARAHFPLSLHGVGLSLGTDGPLDRTHLARTVIRRRAKLDRFVLKTMEFSRRRRYPCGKAASITQRVEDNGFHLGTNSEKSRRLTCCPV